MKSTKNRLIITASALAFMAAVATIALIIDKKSPKKVINSSSTPIKAVCFDIGGVLLTTSIAKTVWQVMINGGTPTLLWYLIKDRKNPIALEKKVGQIIDYMAAQEGVVVINGRSTTESGHPVPLSMRAWQKGELSSSDMLKKIEEAVETMDEKKLFATPNEKRLVQLLAAIITDPNKRVRKLTPINPVVDLVKEIAQQYGPNGKRRFKLVVISNIAKDLAPLVQKKFSNLFDLFDLFVASGVVGHVKPERTIFTHTLNELDLKANQCLFIDDLEENIQTAQEEGFYTFHYQKNPTALRATCVKLGILPA